LNFFRYDFHFLPTYNKCIHTFYQAVDKFTID
jgi:hypothetical protein